MSKLGHTTLLISYSRTTLSINKLPFIMEMYVFMAIHVPKLLDLYFIYWEKEGKEKPGVYKLPLPPPNKKEEYIKDIKCGRISSRKEWGKGKAKEGIGEGISPLPFPLIVILAKTEGEGGYWETIYTSEIFKSIF